jgi:hypothetical protein
MRIFLAKKIVILVYTFKDRSIYDARAEKKSRRLSLYVQCACRSPEPEPGEGGGNGLTLSITANMDALRYKLYFIINVCKKKLDYTVNMYCTYYDIF